MNRTLSLLIAGATVVCSCAHEEQQPTHARGGKGPEQQGAVKRDDTGRSWPPWNGKETVAQYAKHVRLEPAVMLDLGNGVELKLLLIPPGTFMMGSPKSEQGRRVDRPQHGPGPVDVETLHQVTLTRPFYMGKHEVTRRQYEEVIATHSVRGPSGSMPVSGVNWDEAQKFCKVVADRTGMIVRLPTEAEWEFACRAGTRTRFCSGDTVDDLKKVGWASYDGKFGSAKGFKPVGSFLPNAWGLYDMHGNAEEWCQDWQKAYPSDPTTDPRGPAEGRCRIVRGACRASPPENCRSAYRDWGPPSYNHYAATGFRVVADIPGHHIAQPDASADAEPRR